MSKMPICWKCASRITEDVADVDAIGIMFVGKKTVKLIGCKESNKVTDYESAKTHCPLLNRK